MKQQPRKILLAAAIAAMLLLTAACGGSPEGSLPTDASGNTLSDGAGPSAESGKAAYTDAYDPEALFQYGMTPVKDKDTGKYGYKNEAGQWVIEPQFTMANDFQVNKTAFVRTGSNKDQYRLIDRDGAFVSDYIFKRYTDDLEFAQNGIGMGKVCQADGTELGHGYFYLENGEIRFVKREESTLTGFSIGGYAVLDNKAVINDQFEYVIQPQEEYYMIRESNGLIGVDFPKIKQGYSEYGYMDLSGQIVIRGLRYRGGFFADNGIAVVNGQLIDKTGQVVFDVADTRYSVIAGNFTKSDWVEVSKHGANRGGTDFNFVNAEGEYFFPADAYEHSHMDGELAIKHGIYVGPAPVVKDEQGNITGIGGTGEYATVAVNEQLEILYIPSEKGIRDVGAYYADGYALAEDEEEQRVIVDREGNIVMVKSA
ncbi:MAG TPA: WG repeat-containing protein [Firmicutes bacterium]|nr:WG repeat-containing protein [Bacillota bacterium]